MAWHVFLTVDLNNVTTEARNKFYEHLANNQWTKLKLTTSWTARFKPEITKARAVEVTQSDVRSAAAYAGIRDYEAGLTTSEDPATLWKS